MSFSITTVSVVSYDTVLCTAPRVRKPYGGGLRGACALARTAIVHQIGTTSVTHQAAGLRNAVLRHPPDRHAGTHVRQSRSRTLARAAASEAGVPASGVDGIACSEGTGVSFYAARRTDHGQPARCCRRHAAPSSMARLPVAPLRPSRDIGFVDAVRAARAAPAAFTIATERAASSACRAPARRGAVSCRLNSVTVALILARTHD
jgi:hypothetical protein